MSRVVVLLDQIRFARRYTVGLLDATGSSDWFRTPPGGVSHIAWQVGHLAVAGYRLGLERIRGRRDGDEALIPDHVLRHFGRGSVPDPDPSAYLPPEEIRALYDRVHDRIIAELDGLPDPVLEETLAEPHRLCTTKAEALRWCAMHEMVHAGQIALLRRQLGAPPLW